MHIGLRSGIVTYIKQFEDKHVVHTWPGYIYIQLQQTMHSAFTDLHQDGHLLQDYKWKKYISLHNVIILVYNMH